MIALYHRLRDGSLLFFLLPVGYFLAYGFHGFADTDQGFIPALAWRVINGEVPYIDFCYVRPPLSPYLHALELLLWPQRLQMLGMRLDYYIMLWASVYWGMQTMARWQGDRQMPSDNKWWLGILAFLFAAHNFPAMPWHTIDGIFFASLGTWLLTHPNAGWRAVVGLCALALAGLAKQPFAVMLPLGIVALFILHPQKRTWTIVAAAGSALIALGAGLTLLVWPRGFLEAMMNQVAGASGLAEVAQAGFLAYLWPAAPLVAGAAALLWISRSMPRAHRYLRGGFFLALAVGYPIVWAFWAHYKSTFIPPKFGIYHVLWLCALVYGILLWRKGERKAAAGLLLLTAASWASSLSWGYVFPASLAFPGWYGMQGLLFPQARQDTLLSHGRMAAMTLLAGLGFFFLLQFPYRDGPRSEMVAGAGDIFPALSHIRTSPDNLAKLQEYKSLRLAYPDATVLPAMPAADYLIGLKPTTPIDWEHDAEIGPSRMAEVRSILQVPGSVVLVELAHLEEAHSPNVRYRCSLLAEVLARWTPGQVGKHFQVYTSPTKPMSN